ncbi:HEAT repeat domain-containing protein [Granulicella tundricola]|uniref:HEAT domain containing protein n=1 Tax=Granulicella tundricola (strain ATCC BAA-1859 / DSM 23138 / MP5ACTX9) TaxID=1198114 RepID=E8X2E9_GRATM|nr:HEAT repeat domain-containing protein [Granulicella tundricola]ADW68081.1 HEAT domain containing protein [Granulicella tundricola MP5ACTX9]
MMTSLRFVAPTFLATLLLVPSQPCLGQQVEPSSTGQSASLPPDNSVAANKDWAWSMLTTALNDTKHPDTRVQALAALGILGSTPRSLKLILDTLNDPDVDLRTAAILAAGQTKSPDVAADLRRMLDDKEPQVAFAAATTLWKMNDRSGEDILVAVVDGERSANPGLVNGTMHTMNRDLHHPSTLAKLGAMQGAGMLLGPFGMGITALEYMRKNGGNLSRVTAVEQIAENHTAPIRTKLIAALSDKDATVRVAAAKALATFHEPEVAIALADQFPDGRAPVRLTAAAAYLINTGSAIVSPKSSARSHSHKVS